MIYNEKTPDRFSKPVRCESENNPNYKKTKLGWIPEEWDIHSLDEVGTFSRGKGISRAEINDQGYPCVTYGEIYTKHHFFIKEFDSFINDESATASKEIHGGELLFAGSGETLDEIGKCVAYLMNDKAFAGGDIIIFKPKQADSLFLSYLLNSNFILRYRRKLGQGHSVVHVYSSGLKTLNIPFPRFSEQQKIARILSTWDRAIEKTAQLIEAKTLLKKGLMQQLLTGKKRFEEFEGEAWEEYILGSLGKTYNGLTGKSKEDFGRGYPYIPFMNIMNNSRIDPDQMDYVIIDDDENQNRVMYGDIFFTTSSETPEEAGMSSVLLDEINIACLNSFCFGFRLGNFETLHPNFARFYFRSYNARKEIFKLAQGSTRYNISKNEIVKIKLLLPSLNEQQKIASFLSGLEDEIIMLQSSVVRFNDQKKGLMQKLLTGEVRIPPLKGEQKGDAK